MESQRKGAEVACPDPSVQSEGRRNEAAIIGAPKNDEQNRAGEDAKPGDPFGLGQDHLIVIGGVGGRRNAGNENPQACHHHAEDDRKEARAHVKERAEIVVAAFEHGAEPDQGHQPAGIIVFFLGEQVTQRFPPLP